MNLEEDILTALREFGPLRGSELIALLECPCCRHTPVVHLRSALKRLCDLDVIRWNGTYKLVQE